MLILKLRESFVFMCGLLLRPVTPIIHVKLHFVPLAFQDEIKQNLRVSLGEPCTTAEVIPKQK